MPSPSSMVSSRTSPCGSPPAGFNAAAQGRRGDRPRRRLGARCVALRLPALRARHRAHRASDADAEIALSLAVLEYARHARGGRTDPLSLSRNLDRKPPLLDPRSVIETAAIADKPDAYLRGLHPQHPQFERLRQKYLRCNARRCAAGGTGCADQRHRASRSKQAATAPAGRQSAQQLLVNMEQWRWMPEDLGDFYVWVNVPEYHAPRRQGRARSSTPSASSSASPTRRRRSSRTRWSRSSSTPTGACRNPSR